MEKIKEEEEEEYSQQDESLEDYLSLQQEQKEKEAFIMQLVLFTLTVLDAKGKISLRFADVLMEDAAKHHHTLDLYQAFHELYLRFNKEVTSMNNMAFEQGFQLGYEQGFQLGFEQGRGSKKKRRRRRRAQPELL